MTLAANWKNSNLELSKKFADAQNVVREITNRNKMLSETGQICSADHADYERAKQKFDDLNKQRADAHKALRECRSKNPK